MNYDPTAIYSEVKMLLQSRLSDVSFDTFFKDLKPLCIEDDILILESSLPPALTEIISNRFSNDLLQCFQELNYPKLTFKVVEADTYVKNDPRRLREKEIQENAKKAGLNPRYTFQNFVAGATNRLAYASSVAVADYPGNTYNPLYIWGPSGLGKTHLMHSIGHHILDADPNKKVLYISSETFTNELINSITTNTASRFREKYRKIDVLLIDDIQFLGGKEGTQDEFFHTFNTLYEANKQIVISGDRPPEEIEKLEERIRTRFKWGMIADIKPPDYETRVAILQKKASNNNMDIDISVLSYIANNVSSNIRELEGALTRVQGYSLLYKNRPIDVDMAQEALKDYLTVEAQQEATIPRIIDVVCEHYNITPESMRSKKKPREIAYPRQIAMYLCRTITEEPLTVIGSYFGGRDHTTVIHAYTKIADDIKGNRGEELRRTIEDLERRIKGE